MNRVLRTIGALEALSAFLLFFVAIPLKYGTDFLNDKMQVFFYTGLSHGTLFILFVLTLLLACHKNKWSLWTFLGGLLAAIVPLGTLIFDWQIRKRAAAEL